MSSNSLLTSMAVLGAAAQLTASAQETCLRSTSFDAYGTNTLILGSQKLTLRDTLPKDYFGLKYPAVTNDLSLVSYSVSVSSDEFGYPYYTPRTAGDVEREAIATLPKNQLSPGEAVLITDVSFIIQLGDSKFAPDEDQYLALMRTLNKDGGFVINVYSDEKKVRNWPANSDVEDSPGTVPTTVSIGSYEVENYTKACFDLTPVWDKEGYFVGNLYKVTISGLNVVAGRNAAIGIFAFHENTQLRILSQAAAGSSDLSREGQKVSARTNSEYCLSVTAMPIKGIDLNRTFEISSNTDAYVRHTRGLGLQSANSPEGPWKELYDTRYLGVSTDISENPMQFYRFTVGGEPVRFGNDKP